MHKTPLNESEVSITMGVSTKDLCCWCFAGIGNNPEFIRIGTLVYFCWQDLEQWIIERPSFKNATRTKKQSVPKECHAETISVKVGMYLQ